MKVAIASLFDGIGGAPLCAVMHGAEPVWASEIEPFPIKVTKHHFPGMKHYGDICKINGAEVEPVDIFVNGSPCQDVSVAGKRMGMKHGEWGDDEATRSGLFVEVIRIIKEAHRKYGTNKPRFMVWENVPGAFSSNDGEDFRAVLEETARIADSTVSIPRSVNGWANAGSILGNNFSISWRTIDAQYWGVPQRRRRIYLVADFGGQSAPKILFEREGLLGNLAPGREKGQGTADDVEGGTRSAGFKGNQGAKAGGIGLQLECAPTVLAGQECHVVSMATKQLSQNIGENMAMPLMANDYKEPQIVCFEPRSQDGVPGVSTSGLCPTINTAQGGQRQPCIATYQKVTGPLMANTHPGSYTGQDAYQDMFVAHCLKAKANLSFREDSDNIIRTNNRVRRLTPLECERLQGYPDNWTNIPGASDSGRYKGLGNSFSIPCADYVISGCIAEIERKCHNAPK